MACSCVTVGPRPPLFYLHLVRIAFSRDENKKVNIVGRGEYTAVAEAVAKLMNEYSLFSVTDNISHSTQGGIPEVVITLGLKAVVPGQSRFGKRIFEAMDEDDFDDRTDDVYDEMMEAYSNKHGKGERTVGYKFNYKSN